LKWGTSLNRIVYVRPLEAG